MQHKTVGMELVGTANALRRALFEYGRTGQGVKQACDTSKPFCM